MNEDVEGAATVWLAAAHALPPWVNGGRRIPQMWTQDQALLDLKEASGDSPLTGEKASTFYRLIDRR